jgi:LacI family transcriptional regulator
LPKPVGIFCCNDIRGRQLLGAVQNAGLRVPGQIAVLGVDDDEVICELANPPLSSIQPNAQRIGFDGAAMLAQLMVGEIPEAPLVLIPPIRINVRQSSDATCVDDATVALALEFIGNNACLGIGVNDVAKAVSVSRATLERRFKKHLRCSPREEIERVRIAKVKTLLVETDYKLEMIASMTAYTTASHLSIAFRRVVGTTPGEYRGQVGQVEPRIR